MGCEANYFFFALPCASSCVIGGFEIAAVIRSISRFSPFAVIEFLKYMIRHPGFVLEWSPEIPNYEVATKYSDAPWRRLHVVLPPEATIASLVFDV